MSGSHWQNGIAFKGNGNVEKSVKASEKLAGEFGEIGLIHSEKN